MAQGMATVAMVQGWFLVGQGTPQPGTKAGIRRQPLVPGVRSGTGHRIDLLVFEPLQPLELLFMVFAHLLDRHPAGCRGRSPTRAVANWCSPNGHRGRGSVMGLRSRSQELSWCGGLSQGSPLTGIHIWDGPHLGVTSFSTKKQFLIDPNYVDISDSLT